MSPIRAKLRLSLVGANLFLSLIGAELRLSLIVAKVVSVTDWCNTKFFFFAYFSVLRFVPVPDLPAEANLRVY